MGEGVVEAYGPAARGTLSGSGGSGSFRLRWSASPKTRFRGKRVSRGQEAALASAAPRAQSAALRHVRHGLRNCAQAFPRSNLGYTFT